jgi:endonuclease/exonuclease/phosphatase family metal-dependent hydrolase
MRIMPVLRVLTYNVRSLRDDEVAVARLIRAAGPHVVCVQEAPRFFRWRSKAAALARRSGLVVVTGGRPAAANLLLSNLSVEVHATRNVLLSPERGLHQRGVAMTVASLAGSRFALAGTHLDLKPEPRLRHVGELHAALDEFAGPEVPFIVAGDVNDDPGSPVWQALESRGSDAWVASGAAGPGFTSTAANPRRRIDAVFVDQRLRVVSAEVVGDPDVAKASDHRPVLIEIELPEA